MIIITGAAGFIGSCMHTKLIEESYGDLILVDDFSHEKKQANLKGKAFRECVDRSTFFNWIKGKEERIQFVIHLGARTDTTEQDERIFHELNLDYSKKIWTICAIFQIPLIYASSAATYGDGSQGFDDRHDQLDLLKPLNPYGRSKHNFDLWAIEQEQSPFFWAGLKFFNVFGPNEYHKGRMASVVYHTYRQILRDGEMKLFRSHRDEYKDGEQMRDFIYVKDIVSVIFHFMQKRSGSGIYNLGSGAARTFNDLAYAVFDAMDRKRNISYIDTPEDIRDSYQYFTEAKVEKLRAQAYDLPFCTLEEGVSDYVKNYLLGMNYY